MTKPYNRRHFLGSAVALGASAAAWPFSRALGAPTKTTQSEPEGFFTLGRQKDHWWFITPNGKPFFSLGVNHIDPATMRYPENIHLWREKYDGSTLKWIKESVAPIDTPTRTIPAGTRVNSYLFHFRPAEFERVHGVVRFAQPIVGVVCVAGGLRATDQPLGLPGVNYAEMTGTWRGLEPIGVRQGEPSSHGFPGTDEVTLSQDLATLSLRIKARLGGAVDQVRVLTLSDEDDSSPK